MPNIDRDIDRDFKSSFYYKVMINGNNFGFVSTGDILVKGGRMIK